MLYSQTPGPLRENIPNDPNYRPSHLVIICNNKVNLEITTILFTEKGPMRTNIANLNNVTGKQKTLS